MSQPTQWRYDEDHDNHSPQSCVKHVPQGPFGDSNLAEAEQVLRWKGKHATYGGLVHIIGWGAPATTDRQLYFLCGVVKRFGFRQTPGIVDVAPTCLDCVAKCPA